MKTLSVLMMILFAFVYELKANPVDVKVAQSVGAKFLSANAKVQLRGGDLQLVKTYNIARGNAAFYVFNAPSGYVIVAADDCAKPILAYSAKDTFNPDNLPIQMEEYLQGFVKQIEYAFEHNIVGDATIAQQWSMVSDNGKLVLDRNTRNVLPLLTDSWGQGCYYNNQCPEDPNGECGHALTGCTGTALAQILHFWGYPETGNGSMTYTPTGYPQQSVNFGETTYDWDNMPNSLDMNSTQEQVNAVATLLWHCGVSIQANYGPNETSAYPEYVPIVLVDNFRYSEILHAESRADYSDEEWLDMVKESLDMGRPIHYSGYGIYGHSFVCDGYDDNDMLHFNFGWYGLYYDSYFSINAIIPGGDDFTDNNYAVFDIMPNCDGTYYDINTSANIPDAGIIAGAGNYECGSVCTLTTSANSGYMFCSWSENGRIISREPSLNFAVGKNRNIVANFCEVNNGVCTLVFYLGDALGPWKVGDDNVWDGNALVVNYSDGCFENEDLKLKTTKSATFVRNVPSGSHVSLSWIPGDRIEECFFTVGYQNGPTICSVREPASDFTFEFDVNCAGQLYDIGVSSNNVEGGTVSGAGTYIEGATCTLLAKRNLGYNFVNWTKNGVEVSTEPAYSFTVGENASYVANFVATDADYLTVYDGTVINEYVPVYGYYANIMHKSKMVMPATDLFEMAGADISSMRFYLKDLASGSWGDANFMIFFEEVDYIAISNYMELDYITASQYENMEGVTKVYEGKLDGTQPIMDIVFSTPYHYNGGNLLISVFNTELGTFNDAKFYGIDTQRVSSVLGTKFSWMYFYSSIAKSFLPKTTFEYSGGGNVTYYQISVSANPDLGGNVTGGRYYEENTTATLKATPEDGYHFVHWTKNGSVVSTDATYTFTVTEDAEYVAIFQSDYPFVYIGDGGFSTIGFLPTFCIQGYAISQQIYTADEIQRSGIITSVAFKNIESGMVTRSLEIYMKATDKESFVWDYDCNCGHDWIAISESDKVFDGTVTFEANHWTTITFDTPFIYDGASNVVIVVNDISGTGTTEVFNCLSFTNNVAQTMYDFRDGMSFDPTDITLHGSINSIKNQVRFGFQGEHQISVSANPNVIVTGGGFYDSGTVVTLTATAIGCYDFSNWTLNGVVVSTDPIYTFTVTGDAEYIANFEESNICEVTVYEGEESSVNVPAYIYYFDAYAKSQYIIPASDLNEIADNDILSVTWYSNQTEGYTTGCDVIVYLKEVDYTTISEFVAVDGCETKYHGLLNIETDGTCTVTFDTPYHYTGGNLLIGCDNQSKSNWKRIDWYGQTVTGSSIFGHDSDSSSAVSPNAADFIPKTTFIYERESSPTAVTQSTDFTSGWNWWSTYIEQSDSEGMAQLENALGDNGVQIKSQTASTQNWSGNWFGQLTTLENEKSYMVNTSAATTVAITGQVANPANHPVTVQPNWNWIGYPVRTTQSVTAALGDFTPENNDIIKGQGVSSTYFVNSWFPSINLVPGQGYLYKSNATQTKTFTFTESRGEASHVGEYERYWTNDIHAFADNMTVIATVSEDGEEVYNGNIELGAFVNGETRGSVKLEYFEPLDRYFAVLTVNAEEGEYITFGIVNRDNETENYSCNTGYTFNANAVVGTLETPTNLEFKSDGIQMFDVNLYPNPVDRNETITLEMPKNNIIAEVIVTDMLGRAIIREKGDFRTLNGISESGVYNIRIITEKGKVHHSRIIVK